MSRSLKPLARISSTWQSKYSVKINQRPLGSKLADTFLKNPLKCFLKVCLSESLAYDWQKTLIIYLDSTFNETFRTSLRELLKILSKLSPLYISQQTWDQSLQGVVQDVVVKILTALLRTRPRTFDAPSSRRSHANEMGEVATTLHAKPGSKKSKIIINHCISQLWHLQ